MDFLVYIFLPLLFALRAKENLTFFNSFHQFPEVFKYCYG